MHEVIIVGAGPGGLQLAYFLEQLGIKYKVLERSNICGSFFKKYPAQKRLISINKIHTGHESKVKNLRWDWNSLLSSDLKPSFSEFDEKFFPHSDSLVKYLNEFASYHDLTIEFCVDVQTIDRFEGGFRLVDSQGREHKSKILVVGTGFSKSYVPEIPGIEHCIEYGEISNLKEFVGRDVLIIGKGNSAFETANSLTPYASNIHLISPNDFRFAWETHFPGDVRSVNDDFLDTFFLKQQNAILNGVVKSIEACATGYEVVISYTDDIDVDNQDPILAEQTLNHYDKVVKCTGFGLDLEPFAESCSPNTVRNGRLPELTPEWESVNIPNLFFVGTLTQSNDFKRSSSAFIAGLRFNAEVLSRFLDCRINNKAWSYDLLEPGTLYSKITERLTFSSSLWHQFSSLVDLFELQAEPRAAYRHYADVPMNSFKQDKRFENFTGFLFCFGFDAPIDPEERKIFSEHGFIHPILRYYSNGKLIKDCHMREDIYGNWANLEVFGLPFRQVLDEFSGVDIQDA
ncbi:MAG: NAD(P)-binding domain-containing protein [Pseudomonadales bacterium]|nr:NAD(P)-binding domain-containing protein [Pseudomonadales bacterium]